MKIGNSVDWYVYRSVSDNVVRGYNEGLDSDVGVEDGSGNVEGI